MRRWLWIPFALLLLAGAVWLLSSPERLGSGSDMATVPDVEPVGALASGSSRSAHSPEGTARTRNEPGVEEHQPATTEDQKRELIEPRLFRFELRWQAADYTTRPWKGGQFELQSWATREQKTYRVVADEDGVAMLNLPFPVTYIVRTLDPFVIFGREAFPFEPFDVSQKPQILRFRSAGCVRGRVVDELGQPVEGARVAALKVHASGDFGIEISPIPRGYAAVTGADGSFVIDRVEPKLSYAIEATHDIGHATSSPIRVSPGQFSDLPDLVVRPERTLTCRARDVAGQAVSGVDIEVVELGPERDRNVSVLLKKTVTTDERGLATVRLSDVERIEVRAQRDGFASWHRSVPVPANGELELTMERGHVLEGTIIGYPDDGSWSRLCLLPIMTKPRRLPDEVLESDIESDGSFRFESLAAGRYELSASGCREVELDIPEDANVTLEYLQRRVTVEVLDPEGVPFRGECTWTILPERAQAFDEPYCETGLGEWGVEPPLDYWVGPGRYTLLVCDAELESTRGSTSFEVTPETEVTSVTVNLQRSDYVIEGKVVWADTGAGVADCEIGSSRTGQVTTNAEGDFQLSVQGPGVWSLSWTRSLEGSDHGWWEAIDVQVTEPRTQVRIEWQRLGEVAGRVSKEGLPVCGAKIAIWRGGYSRIDLETDANGTYRFPEVPGGTYRIACTFEGMAGEQVVTVEPGGRTAVDFELRDDRARLTGTVLANGEPIQHVQVEWWTSQGSVRTFTDARGAFSLEDAPATTGSLVVGWTGPGEGLSLERTMTLLALEERVVNFQIDTAEVVFRTRGPDGRLFESDFSLESEASEPGFASLGISTGSPVQVPLGRYRTEFNQKPLPGIPPALIEVTKSGEIEIRFTAGTPVDIVVTDRLGTTAKADYWAFPEGSSLPIEGPLLKPGAYEIWAYTALEEFHRLGSIRVTGTEPLRFDFRTGAVGIVRERTGERLRMLYDDHGNRLIFLDIWNDVSISPGPYRLVRYDGTAQDITIRPNEVTIIETE